MVHVSIQRGDKRRSFVHESDPRMTPTMNATLMSLGCTEETFQIEVVYGQVYDIPADEESWGEGAHGLRHFLPQGVRVAVEAPREREE